MRVKVTDRGIFTGHQYGYRPQTSGGRANWCRITTAPMACFVAAVRALAEIVAKENHHG
ncbi:hypothetical protein ACP0HM_24070 [Escherichia coli]